MKYIFISSTLKYLVFVLFYLSDAFGFTDIIQTTVYASFLVVAIFVFLFGGMLEFKSNPLHIYRSANFSSLLTTFFIQATFIIIDPYASLTGEQGVPPIPSWVTILPVFLILLIPGYLSVWIAKRKYKNLTGPML